MNGDYIKPSDVAKRLGVTRGAVYKWIREGKLKAVRFGENAVRIPRAELEAFERKAAEQKYNPSEESQGVVLSPALQT